MSGRGGPSRVWSSVQNKMKCFFFFLSFKAHMWARLLKGFSHPSMVGFGDDGGGGGGVVGVLEGRGIGRGLEEETEGCHVPLG